MDNQMVNISLGIKERKIVFVAMMAQVFGFMLTSFGPGLALPQILEGFGMMQYFALVGVIYSFCQCIVVPVAAALGDRIGRKWINTGSLIMMCVGCIMTFFAPNFVTFIISWAFCGIFVGGFSTGPFLIMSDIIEPEKRAKYAGILSSALSAGMIAAPLIGGVIVDAGFTRGVYLMPIPFYVFSIVVVWKLYPHKANAGKIKFDGLGLFLLTITVAPFVIVLNFGGSLFGWISPITFACIALVIVGGILLVKRETKIEQPAIMLGVLKNRNVAITAVFSFLFNAYSVLAAGFVVLFGQTVLQTSATISGTLMLPQTIVSLILPLVLAPWVGKDPRRYKYTFVVEGLTAAITLLGISRLVPGSPLVMLYALMAIGGIANTSQNAFIVPFQQLNLDMKLYGAAQGTTQFLGVLGVTLTSSLFGLLIGSTTDMILGLSRCFLAGGIICVGIAVIALLFIKGEKPRKLDIEREELIEPEFD
ncbi:MAG: MFS transporter [Suipraeoptans sp.]